MFREVKKGSWKLSLQLLLVVAAALLLWGCSGGGSDYDAPEATNSTPITGQTQNVLIDADTLKGWVDAGLVNNDASYENVVILTAGGTYDAGHIPGAQNWSVAGMERWEGPVYSGNMVLDGPTMDAMLCEYGIDERTTIVFAGSGNPSRLYFNFRYWGFPKSKLKILNGNQAAWTNAGYALTTVVPNVATTSFSVRDLPAMNQDVRASLNEVMIAVENETAAPLDTYGNTYATAPAVGGIFSDYSDGDGPNAEDASDYVIFQGTMLGAKHANRVPDFYVAGNLNGEVESAANIQASLEALGIDGSKPIITYCRAGNLASYGFMPIDVTVGWDVMVYDGSWSQWGSLTNETGPTYVPSADYALPAELSEWATDVLTTGNEDGVTLEPPVYNINDASAPLIEKPRFRIIEGMLTPSDSDANSIEIEDLEYYNTPPTGGAATSTSGAAGGGC